MQAYDDYNDCDYVLNLPDSKDRSHDPDKIKLLTTLHYSQHTLVTVEFGCYNDKLLSMMPSRSVGGFA